MFPIFDGHNDTLTALLNDTETSYQDGFLNGRTRGHIDLPRAKAGGLRGGFFAIYTDQDTPIGDPTALKILTEDGYTYPDFPAINPDRAATFTDMIIARAYELADASAGEAVVVTTTDALRETMRADKLAMALQIEGAAAIKPDLSNLQDYYDKGIRSITLVWSRPNAFGYGVPFRYPAGPDVGPGLTAAGKDLVGACNELGILIDLSHLNEQGFWDVAHHASAPLVATHSCAHALTAVPRNLTDAQLDAIRTSDGVVGVNFSMMMLHPQSDSSPDGPYGYILDHIDYIVQRIGVEHVAFGSDFDGTRVSKQLKDAAGLPLLIDGLQERGYGTSDIEKIAYQNWWRVIEATWR